MQGNVRERVGQIQEERPGPVAPDEADGLLGVSFGQRLLNGRPLDDLFVAHQRHGESLVSLAVHVVAVGKPEVRVEAVPRGQELRLIAQVPLADAPGRVTPLFQNLRNRRLSVADAGVRVRVEDVGQPHPGRIAPGHDSRPRRSADRRRVEAGKLHPLGGHAVEARGSDERRAVAPHVLIPLIVGQNHNEVRRTPPRFGFGGFHPQHQRRR